MRYHSPLRYPGGKAAIAPLLQQTIEMNGLSGCTYYEPFAGGAGAALRLLHDGVVSELRLNDLDTRITAFWNAALNESERFAGAIRSVPLSISEWDKQQSIYIEGDTNKPFELGFATFYLNRCNRSGVLLRARPIGGRGQQGEWKIDARFNRDALAARVTAISQKRKHIHVTNMDAEAFLVRHLPRTSARRRVFAYLDPPYYSNGNRLYLNHYGSQDHRHLARYMKRQAALKWIMSYDDADPIRGLYSFCAVSRIPIRYSLHRKRHTHEIMISPSHVRLPESVTPAAQGRVHAAA